MSILDFLFPKKCLGCSKKGRYFCQDCVAKIEPAHRLICPICVRPSPLGQTHPRCQTKYTIDGLTSVFTYRGVIRESIKQLKYNFRFDLAEELVTLILNSIKRSLILRNKVSLIQQLNFKRTMVVPVPLHHWRQDWRGFNQAVVLAKILAEKLDLPFCGDLLVRTRYTEPQTGLKKEAREKNVEDAFGVSKKYKIISENQQTSVLLFDDVWTTGATMKTCANFLKRAGFKKVWGLTVAR